MATAKDLGQPRCGEGAWQCRCWPGRVESPTLQVTMSNCIVCSNAEIGEGASLKDAQVGVGMYCTYYSYCTDHALRAYSINCTYYANLLHLPPRTALTTHNLPYLFYLLYRRRWPSASPSSLAPRSRARRSTTIETRTNESHARLGCCPSEGYGNFRTSLDPWPRTPLRHTQSRTLDHRTFS